MNARTAALLASLALIGLLAFLTISVMIDDGFTPLVAVSLLILGLLGFGVVGALTTPPEGVSGSRLAALALLLAPVTVVVALYLGPLRDDGASDPPQATAVAPDVAGLPEPGGSLEPRSPAPIRLTGVDAFALRFKKPPRAALVFDVDSGEVLYRRRPLTVLPMASLTKIMTALVVTQETEPDERVKITKAALRYQGSGVGVLPKGKRVRLESLLNGLLLVSGNDAADRAGGARLGQRAQVRAADEREGAPVGAALHPLRLVARAGERQPLLRRRPRRDDPAGDARPPDRPDRAPPAGRRSGSRSRAAGCSWRATTRCCGPATAGRSG